MTTEQTTIHDLLAQGDVWQDRAGTRHPIASMDADYCRNTIAWLERNAGALARARHARLLFTALPPVGDAACDAFDAVMEEAEHDSVFPLEWMGRQPLMRALRLRQADCGIPPVDALWPDELGGPWFTCLEHVERYHESRAEQWAEGGYVRMAEGFGRMPLPDDDLRWW